uniref:Terminase small subunit n=2 Tax=unclassified bacterial viruses TaxID=12333 RepID=A0AAU6VZ78_9VIRU
MEQKNKGGRPTKAEMAARGITKTELDAGLRILKKVYGQAIDKMIEISDDESIPAKDRFKMKQVLVDMYNNLYKANEALKLQLARGAEGEVDETEKPLAPVFNFAK